MGLHIPLRRDAGKVEPWQEYPTHSGEVEEGSFVAWPTAYIQPRREALQTARPKQNLSETQGLKDALHPDKKIMRKSPMD